MFRSAVGIFEGVKGALFVREDPDEKVTDQVGDALFSFQPPINMLALLVL